MCGQADAVVGEKEMPGGDLPGRRGVDRFGFGDDDMPGREALRSLCSRPGRFKRDRLRPFRIDRAHEAQHALERGLRVELASIRAERLPVSLGQGLQHRADDLDPLDRIDAEVRFEALVEADHVARIAGLLLDDGEQHVGQLRTAEARAHAVALRGRVRCAALRTGIAPVRAVRAVSCVPRLRAWLVRAVRALAGGAAASRRRQRHGRAVAAGRGRAARLRRDVPGRRVRDRRLAARELRGQTRRRCARALRQRSFQCQAVARTRPGQRVANALQARRRARRKRLTHERGHHPFLGGEELPHRLEIFGKDGRVPAASHRSPLIHPDLLPRNGRCRRTHRRTARRLNGCRRRGARHRRRFDGRRRDRRRGHLDRAACAGAAVATACSRVTPICRTGSPARRAELPLSIHACRDSGSSRHSESSRSGSPSRHERRANSTPVSIATPAQTSWPSAWSRPTSPVPSSRATATCGCPSRILPVKPTQHRLRADLDEDARAVAIHRLDLGDEFDRAHQVLGHLLADLGHVGGVRPGRRVRVHRRVQRRRHGDRRRSAPPARAAPA